MGRRSPTRGIGSAASDVRSVGVLGCSAPCVAGAVPGSLAEVGPACRPGGPGEVAVPRKVSGWRSGGRGRRALRAGVGPEHERTFPTWTYLSPNPSGGRAQKDGRKVRPCDEGTFTSGRALRRAACRGAVSGRRARLLPCPVGSPRPSETGRPSSTGKGGSCALSRPSALSAAGIGVILRFCGECGTVTGVRSTQAPPFLHRPAPLSPSPLAWRARARSIRPAASGITCRRPPRAHVSHVEDQGVIIMLE